MNLRRAMELAVAGGVLVVGFTLCRRGIVLSDEGYLLMQALDMARGKVLYRDMDSFVAPGVWFLLAALFRVVEPTVLATRVPALVGYLVMVGASARIADRVAGRTSALVTAVGLAAAAVWAFPAWTVSFYSPYAVTCALLALERLVAWQQDARPRDLVWTGVWLGLAVLFKQNYGVLAAAGCAVTIAGTLLAGPGPFGRRMRAIMQAGGRVTVGMVAPLAPAVVYFLYHGAARDALEALVMHPFRGFLVAHTLPYLGLDELMAPRLMAGIGRFTYGAYAMVNTGLHLRWDAGAVRFVEQLHVLLYWIPLVLGLLAIVLVVRAAARRALDHGLLAVLSVAGLMFLGVFPRADFNHLMNVYQPIVLLGAVVAQRLLSVARRPSRRVFGAIVLGLGVAPYTIVAAIWFVSLGSLLSAPLAAARGGGVMVDLWEAGMIDFEVEHIRKHTAPDEAVLTVPGLAMLNFLAERDVPSRYYNLYAVHIAHDEGSGVVEAMERRGTRLVVADYNNFFSDAAGLRDYAPVLSDHLRRVYEPVASVAVDKHLLLTRRATPLARRTLTNALAHCDLSDDEFAVRIAREHLFFDALYHYFRDGAVDDGDDAPRILETACALRVPETASLRVQIGYRQPTAIGDDAALVGEVRVRPDGHDDGEKDTLVLRAPLRLERAEGWDAPPPAEYAADLSAFAGHEVTLVFRTEFRGRVEMNPLELWGFAMVWHDPRIEHGREG